MLLNNWVLFFKSIGEREEIRHKVLKTFNYVPIILLFGQICHACGYLVGQWRLSKLFPLCLVLKNISVLNFSFDCDKKIHEMYHRKNLPLRQNYVFAKSIAKYFIICRMSSHFLKSATYSNHNDPHTEKQG